MRGWEVVIASDALITLMVRSERGELSLGQVHWALLAEVFTEVEVMSAHAEARSQGLTTSNGWHPDRLTEKGRQGR